MTVIPIHTESSPACSLALKTSEPEQIWEPDADILATIDRIYTLLGEGGFTLKLQDRAEDCALYEKQVTPGNLYIEVFEPLTEYGHTESFIYWVEARPVELKDL